MNKWVAKMVSMIDNSINIKPIGVVSSWFVVKNGTPRQANICPESRASIELNQDWFDNPALSLEGLEQFSHLWILFNFNKNDNKRLHPRVKPPRLDGKRLGVFATRSPHRPNAIGLSLVKLDHVKDNKIFITGADILNGTPVLDIKPYIPDYDDPSKMPIKPEVIDLDENETETVRPDWIGCQGVTSQANGSSFTHKIVFTQRSLTQLKRFHACDREEEEGDGGGHEEQHLIGNKQIYNTYLNHKLSKKTDDPYEAEQHWSTGDPCIGNMKCLYCLTFLKDWKQAASAIHNILSEDPRSARRRNHGEDRLYYFTVDSMHVTCWFDTSEQTVEVIKVRPNYAYHESASG